jgi:hypothetical protein
MSHTSLSLRDYTTGTITSEAVAFLVMRPAVYDCTYTKNSKHLLFVKHLILTVLANITVIHGTYLMAGKSLYNLRQPCYQHSLRLWRDIWKYKQVTLRCVARSSINIFVEAELSATKIKSQRLPLMLSDQLPVNNCADLLGHTLNQQLPRGIYCQPRHHSEESSTPEFYSRSSRYKPYTQYRKLNIILMLQHRLWLTCWGLRTGFQPWYEISQQYITELEEH